MPSPAGRRTTTEGGWPDGQNHSALAPAGRLHHIRRIVLRGRASHPADKGRGGGPFRRVGGGDPGSQRKGSEILRLEAMMNDLFDLLGIKGPV
ncbi:hypothetical protein, partial [Mesorhizobium sp. M7A.F.Ca.CA.002.15.2.1]|uniref:hypothetical protein n=1 Tax=Mesorhizobium sp. M7A.F.Ca.CA.002.15.2.1 TaxID=2496678 RepID=UPI0019D021BA